jgi:hypothetical protein
MVQLVPNVVTLSSLLVIHVTVRMASGWMITPARIVLRSVPNVIIWIIVPTARTAIRRRRVYARVMGWEL